MMALPPLSIATLLALPPHSIATILILLVTLGLVGMLLAHIMLTCTAQLTLGALIMLLGLPPIRLQQS